MAKTIPDDNAAGVSSVLPLAALNGKSPNGTWQLRVQDLAALDVGTLISCSLQRKHR